MMVLQVRFFDHEVRSDSVEQSKHLCMNSLLPPQNFDNHDAHWKLNPKFFKLGSKIAAGGAGIVYEGGHGVCCCNGCQLAH